MPLQGQNESQLIEEERVLPEERYPREKHTRVIEQHAAAVSEYVRMTRLSLESPKLARA